MVLLWIQKEPFGLQKRRPPVRCAGLRSTDRSRSFFRTVMESPFCIQTICALDRTATSISQILEFGVRNSNRAAKCALISPLARWMAESIASMSRPSALKRSTRGSKFTNGIAFGPDLDLYVNETITGAVYRYGRRTGGFGPREYFANVLNDSPISSLRGPDGMAFGSNGKLYVAVYGQGEVVVLGMDGKVADRMLTRGSLPTNVAFGLSREKNLYVTEYELGQLEIFPVETTGLTLWT